VRHYSILEYARFRWFKVAIALSVGVPVGLAAGYLGGWFDALVSRMNDDARLARLALARAPGAFPPLGRLT